MLVWRAVDLQCRFVGPRLPVTAPPKFGRDVRGCLLSDANSGDGREPCHVRGRDRGEGANEEQTVLLLLLLLAKEHSYGTMSMLTPVLQPPEVKEYLSKGERFIKWDDVSTGAFASLDCKHGGGAGGVFRAGFVVAWECVYSAGGG